MMKPVILTLFFSVLCSCSYAQVRGESGLHETHLKTSFTKRPARCPAFYVTTGTGVNYNTGFAGVNFDRPVAKKVSIAGGLGRSTWGYKFFLGGSWYFKPCHRGWAIGTGLTYNTGIRNYQQYDVETIYGVHETVQLDLHPQPNVFIAAYHYWTIGRRYNRIFIELGWSQALATGPKFRQTDGDPITKTAIDAFNLLAPGGPLIGGGFSLGLYK